MAKTLRTVVEQDVTRHTLGHIYAKLKGQRASKTTFVIVEGADDLAFYRRFFDRRIVAAYYSTKLKNDGEVIKGGCEELQHIVRTVLDEGRTDKILGIMDTDSRKYINGYVYPQNIFHSDYRDMEMTALSTASVKHALAAWMPDFDVKVGTMIPMLRYAGVLRILNDKYRIGCNFGRKCKIDFVYDNQRHQIHADWKRRYGKAFLKSSLLNKKKTIAQKAKTALSLFAASLNYLFYPYRKESVFDVSQGHDAIQLLSLVTARTSIYNKQTIWEKCFDAYTPDDFARTNLYAEIAAWQEKKGVYLFKATLP